MSDIRFTTRLRGLNSAIDDIEDAIERGIRQSGDSMGRLGVEEAQSKIRQEGAVWLGDLINSFEYDFNRRGGMFVLVIRNVSDHAGPIEFGADYEGEGPPIAPLIPWVRTKMAGFEVPDGWTYPSDEDLDLEGEVQYGGTSTTVELDQVEDDVLEKAFWLQHHIKEEGIDGIHFMREAKRWVERHGDENVAAFINSNLQTL